MKPGRFVLFSLAWLSVMAALSAIGPLGRHPSAAMILYGASFSFLVGMFRTFPDELRSSQAPGLIVALGLAARCAFFFFPPNTDIYRYIWEGAIQNSGFNPYVLTPEDPLLAPYAQGELSSIWQLINNKSFSAVYPPGALLVFRLLAWIDPTPLCFKIALVLFDVGSMTILAAILRQRQLPPSRLLFYAANPLVIVFIAGEGHVDALQVFFLLLGCWFLGQRRHLGSSLSLGLAIMSKYLAAAAAPFFWNRRAGSGQTAFLLPAALFLVFISAGPALFQALGEFVVNMHYNNAVTEMLGMVFGRGWLAAAGIVFLLALGWIWLTEDDPLRGIYLAIGCLLVLLPTLHPWYLVLMAPFMCLFPSRAWLYLQAAVLFTFPVLGHEFRTGVFREIPWLRLPEYLPFYGLLIWGLVRGGCVSRDGPFSEPRSISIIVPTLNEAPVIGRCLAALRGLPQIAEIIVADGGSSDGTGYIAKARGARVVVSGRGRGLQIRAAAETVRGDVLLILHADAVLNSAAPAMIIRALTADRAATGGCFGMQFEDQRLTRRFIAVLNNFRALATGIAFGDQVQFVRKEALDAIGGFPALMLMEDVELSLRMKRIGRVAYLGQGVTVSGRRWQDGSFLNRLGMVVGLFFRYLLVRRLGADQGLDERCYRTYYGMHA
jgi:rSAM/selenodomain-associated transferase 2